VYFELGADRSLAAVGQKLGKSTTILSRWSTRWQWVSRAAIYDRELDDEKRQRQLELARAEAEEWQVRGSEFRKRRWLVGVRYLDRIEKMLDFPLASITTETREGPNGETIRQTTVKPGRWTFDTAGRLSVHAERLCVAALRNEGSISDVNPDERDEKFDLEDFVAPEPAKGSDGSE
jgi:hypothetical protein